MRYARRVAATTLSVSLLLIGTPAGAVGQTAEDEPIPGPIRPDVDEPIPGPIPGCRTIEPQPYADLSGCDLSGADFTGVNLSYADLTGANLSNANLSSAVLLGVTAMDADLSGAILWDTTLIDANLRRADLGRVSLRGSDLTGADLSGADLDGSRLRASRIAGADLSGADLRGATLAAVDLTEANLSGADAAGVDFTDSVLAGVRFDDADLALAVLDGLALNGQSLAGADLYAASMVGTLLVRANLARTDLTDASFRKADLSHTQFEGALWDNTTCPDGRVTTGVPCPVSSVNEAGFLSVGAIDYSFPRTIAGIPAPIEYTTTPANLFYSFQAADADGVDPIEAPLFVMLNGGPGAATTANLMANNTAQYTVNTEALDRGDPGFAKNPNSWTAMGNLLYIDPPLTGFSYNTRPEATDSVVDRGLEFLRRGNFNAFIDADQVLRAVLLFLEDHPELAANPVIFVGESYGGVRVTTMLNMLLFSDRYGSAGTIFRDPGLVRAIREHFDRINVTDPLTPQVVAQQFGQQVLIQPQLSRYQGTVQSELYWPADGSASVIDEVAKDAGKGSTNGFTRDRSKCRITVKGVKTPLSLDPGTCAIMVYVPEFGRDRYNWKKPADWSDRQDAVTAQQYNSLGKLNTILGFDVATIPGFDSEDRVKVAYSTLIATEWPLDVLGIPQLPGVDEDVLLEEMREAGYDPRGEAARVDVQACLAGGECQTSLGPLYPGIVQRAEAARVPDGASLDPDSLAAHFGRLGEADRYYGSWNQEIYAAFALNYFAPEFYAKPINPDSDVTFGDMFLQNIRYVKTFLTDADYDLVISSQALPIALSRHKGVAGVDRKSATAGGSGVFTVRFQDGSATRLYYPRYASSGHAVAATQPAKLRSDVQEWLDCTSDSTCF
jgi:uncharacterized protein YjbI with pentapeptide repeats